MYNLRMSLLFEFQKLAEYELLPHQQRVVDKLKNPDVSGVLVYHGLGSGKTLTSIAAMDQLGMPADVITPASLRENYAKEMTKHLGYVPDDTLIRSYEAANKNPDKGPQGLVVVDEVHNLGRSDSQRSSLLSKIHPHEKMIMLSGSPLRNNPSELAPIINALYGSRVVSRDTAGFNDEFIQDVNVPVSRIERMRGIRPGIIQKIKNEDKLRNLLAGRVDYYDSKADSTDFPDVVERIIPVEMSDRQKRVYDFATGKMPRSLRRKMESLLPPDKRELSQLNAFMQAARQIGDNPSVYDGGRFKTTPEDATKIMAASKNIIDRYEKDKAIKAIVYSNYLSAALEPYDKRLAQSNIPHAFITGNIPFKQRKQSVEDYNNGLLNVLLLSAAGSEGLDLKGTNLVQLMEPHWQDERLNQAIGRAVRYKSHSHLPEDQRKVEVERYISTIPGSWSEKLMNKKPPSSADEYLVDMSKRKSALNEQFLNIIRQASDLPPNVS
jgi:SNF2 family DNA or RNA helicase